VTPRTRAAAAGTTGAAGAEPPDRRRALLDEYFALEDSRDDPAAVARRAVLRGEYEAALPLVPLARCPYTGEVFTTTLDTAGLDGLWWDHSLPIRGLVDERPGTFFALTGAVALSGDVEPAPFDRMPGPEVPYVVPRMILHDDVRAVVSQVGIGPHTGWAVTYFASPVPPGLKRFNDWGAETYTYVTEDDEERWDSCDEEIEDLDHDLARWIASGDLLWIAPGDASLTLRSDAAGCPYVGLEGRREFALVQPPEPATAPRSRTRRSTARPSA
jgi:hypothetical protein